MLVSHPRNMNHIQQLDPSKSTNVDLVREKEPVIFVFFFFWDTEHFVPIKAQIWKLPHSHPNPLPFST